MAIWAVTGGIACGKSAVITAFENLGVTCYSADKDAREAMHDPEVNHAVKMAFPDAVDQSGQLDRAKLGQLIYADPTRRTQLGAIMHPFIRTRMSQRIEQNHASDVTSLELYEVPLLFEGRLESWFDGSICVACNLDEQKRRLSERHLARYNTVLTNEEVSQILDSQLPVTEKAALADFVIDNSGSPNDLVNLVQQLFETLMQKAGE
jgi:dephospho-CoA kinase